MKARRDKLEKILNYFYLIYILDVSLVLLYMITGLFIDLGIFYMIVFGAMVIGILFFTYVLLISTKNNISDINDFLTEYLVMKNKNSKN
jgi:hypothetical protein